MSILVIGSTNMDVKVKVDHLPQKGETIIGSEMSEEYGGKGANQACAAGKLGSEVTFLTCVGNDAHGQEILSYLKEQQVDVSKVKYTDHLATGLALIHVDQEGNNTIAVVQGANAACDAAYIREHEACFQECDIVLLQMEIPLSAVEESIALAARYGKQVILNPAPANADLPSSCYPAITYITPNETEALLMGEGTDIEESVRHILAKGAKHVLVTLGSQGAAMYQNDQPAQFVDAKKVDVVDTVGAGDCFSAAFAVALDHGMMIQDAIRFANEAAAIAVTRKGAQTAMPYLHEMPNV